MPRAEVKRLLLERHAAIRGIAVPGMPAGSPGMEMPDGASERYQVLAFDASGVSFKFSAYKVSVRFEGPVALATESYRYRIEPKTGEIAERVGVSTSVLKKVGRHLEDRQHARQRPSAESVLTFANP